MSNIYDSLKPNILAHYDFRSGGINDLVGSNHASFDSAPVFINKLGLKYV